MACEFMSAASPSRNIKTIIEHSNHFSLFINKALPKNAAKQRGYIRLNAGFRNNAQVIPAQNAQANQGKGLCTVLFYGDGPF